MPKQISVLHSDIVAIIEFLETAKTPVWTPKDIASVCGIPYRRVTHALFSVHTLQYRNPGSERVLKFDGTQYQSFVYAAKWIPPFARRIVREADNV